MKSLWLCVVLTVVVGCSSGNPFVQSRDEGSIQEEIQKFFADHQKDENAPKVLVLAGEGDVGIGDKALKALREKHDREKSFGNVAQRYYDWARGHELTLIGSAIGLALLLLIVWAVLRYFRLEGSVKSAVSAIEKKIKGWVAVRDAPGVTPELRAEANKEISALNSIRADTEKTIRG